MSIDIEKLQHDPVTRRAFLQRMGAAGLGLAAVSLLHGCGGGGSGGGDSNNSSNFPGIPGSSNDIKALNYALTLEILEADLYQQALNKASGQPQNPTPTQETALGAFGSYTRSGSIGDGSFPGPGPAGRGDIGYLYLKQFAFVEAAHRDFLRAQITMAGGTPVARAANGYRFNASNNPGSTIADILKSILVLEEEGTRAYLGAVPLINNVDYLQAAGTIYSTECRHSAAVRYLLNQNDTGPSNMQGDTEVAQPPSNVDSSVREQLFEKAVRPSKVIKTVQAFIAPAP